MVDSGCCLTFCPLQGHRRVHFIMLYMNHQCSSLYLPIPPLMKPLSLFYFAPFVFPLSFFLPLLCLSGFHSPNLLLSLFPRRDLNTSLLLRKSASKKKHVSVYLKLREKKWCQLFDFFFITVHNRGLTGSKGGFRSVYKNTSASSFNYDMEKKGLASERWQS